MYVGQAFYSLIASGVHEVFLDEGRYSRSDLLEWQDEGMAQVRTNRRSRGRASNCLMPSRRSSRRTIKAGNRKDKGEMLRDLEIKYLLA
jgi:hypothetical protein